MTDKPTKKGTEQYEIPDVYDWDMSEMHIDLQKLFAESVHPDLKPHSDEQTGKPRP
ncbi:hypothetical protein [Effusibacillus dendaii]|uniref:Uncharacterized protein n=1 Tax=Effusibacillus dendaii TaxID=2743772 RepID=A0A7I8D8L2_9BACL|nr:hypothetical protein [Effusibacillus dendaii]BCJ85156.1 hypothetical protein skT53_01410 [Effusibacillus dendaii]